MTAHWSEILTPHLRTRIKDLSEEDWTDIERAAFVLAQINNIPLIVAEANSMLALLNAKEKGMFSRLLN